MLIQVKRILLPVIILLLCFYCSVIFALDSIGSTARTLKAATCSFNTVSTVMALLRSRSLIVVAVVILIISLMYLFYLAVLYLITKSRYSKDRYILKIIELNAINEKLRRELTRLEREHAGSMEYIIDAEESTRNEFRDLDPQKMKALVELAKSLR